MVWPATMSARLRWQEWFAVRVAVEVSEAGHRLGSGAEPGSFAFGPVCPYPEIRTRISSSLVSWRRSGPRSHRSDFQ